MKGIKYVTDDTGARVAAQVDLAQWGEEWREFLDGLEAENEPKEPSIPWRELKAEMEEASRRVRA
jgi:hypothetical protein